jgi:hypothetical protein
MLRCIRAIGAHIYVAGTGRQAYHRYAARDWRRHDAGMVVPLGTDEVVGIEAIDGFSESELYGVGLGGEIWHCSDGAWVQIESPTDVRLTSIVCAPDGFAYVAGQLGTILRGRRDRWDVINHDAVGDTIHDLAWFDDRVWLTTSTDLLVLSGGIVTRPALMPSNSSRFQYLGACADVLWSFGEQDLNVFDGSLWTAMPNP